MGKGMQHFVHNDIPWEAQSDKSRRKVLRLDDSLYVAVIQWDAGFTLPRFDEHQGEEIVYVIDGTFIDHAGACGPGSVVRGDAGSSHVPGTDKGCTFLIVRSLGPGERELFRQKWVRPSKL